MSKTCVYPNPDHVLAWQCNIMCTLRPGPDCLSTQITVLYGNASQVYIARVLALDAF